MLNISVVRDDASPVTPLRTRSNPRQSDSVSSIGMGYTKFTTRDTDVNKNRKYFGRRIDGLYAIVIPSGGGKTTLAGKFKQLDIDQILDDTTEDAIRLLRGVAHRCKDSTEADKCWSIHNNAWYDACYNALRKYDFNNNTRVLFCHTDEVGMACGAEIIGIYVPSEALHNCNMSDSGRMGVSREIGVDNRDLLIRKCSGSPLFKTYYTRENIELMVATAMSKVMMAPYIGKVLGDQIFLTRYYKTISYSVPRRIIKGDYRKEDIDIITRCVKAGDLPDWYIADWCSSYAESMVIDNSDYNCCYQWLKLLSSINRINMLNVGRQTITGEMLYDTTIDWFKYFPFSDKRQETQGNVRIRNMCKVITGEDAGTFKLCLEILNTHCGSNHTFVCCLLSYVIGIMPILSTSVSEMIINSGMLHVPEREWVHIHNEVHKLVRSTHKIFGIELSDDDYANVQYTYSLIGRRQYEIDPQNEIVKRAAHRLEEKLGYSEGLSRSSYWILFKEGVDKAYSRLASYQKKSWANNTEFYKHRYYWSAGGAVTNLPDDMCEYKEAVGIVYELKDGLHHIKASPNKKILMEKLSSPAELVAVLYNHWGYNATRLATKPNEPAKNRVLIPGSFLHYVAMTYVLGIVERTGPVGNVRLGESNDIDIIHFDRNLGTSAFYFMLDFADHNAQHSVPEMQYIIAALEDKMFDEQGVSNDIIWFVNWVVKSFENMEVMDSNDTLKPLNSGLYSGWRGTTWINSVACQAYVYIGLTIQRRLYGSDSLLFFEGAGDDVKMEFRLALDAIRFFECMRWAGFEMTEIKQLLLRGGNEFLRLITENGSMRYCINRILPNFVSGDLERSNPNMLSRAGGAYATCEMMKRRGLLPKFASQLFNIYLKKWMRIKIDDNYIPVHDWVIHGDASCNGMGVPDEYGRTWMLSKVLPDPRPQRPKNILAPCYASTDGAEVVADELKKYNIEDIRIDDLRNDMISDTYGLSTINEKEYFESSEWKELIKSPPCVIDTKFYRASYNPYLLMEVMYSIGNDDDMQFNKMLNFYQSFKNKLNYTCVDMDKISDIISVDAYAADRALEFKAPMAWAFTIPEYMLHCLCLSMRKRIYSGLLSCQEAEMEFCTLAYTYTRVFPSNRM